MKEPGLDGRHRDKDGEIDRKRSNTRVDTLRRLTVTIFYLIFAGTRTSAPCWMKPVPIL
jgi:hypothetical protein